jgi:pyridoxal phosphate enzyme (YggS family)
MSIAENMALIAQEIKHALARRRSDVTGTGQQVKLVAVTKNQEVTAMREAIDAGASVVGENRVQEALSKNNILDREVDWHLIGHLQTNKVRQAVPQFALIHSVDSERLLVEIDRIASKIGKRQDVLLQVNVAGEDTKFGINPDAVMDLADKASKMANIRLCGLMTIAPYFANKEEVRPVFRELYRLFLMLKDMRLNNTNIEWLSMGMTNDYVIAVEEGANLVRVGTAIFGPRHYQKEEQ